MLRSPAFVGGPSGASSSRSAAQQHLRCFVGPAGPPRYAARGRRSSLAFPAPLMRHSGPPLVVGPPGARRPPGRGPRPPPQPGAPALLRWSGGRCPSAHGRRQPLSARLRAPAASLWSPLLAARGCRALTCLARCARAAGPPPAALFPPGLRSGGGRGRGSAALLRSAAPPQGGCFVGGLGACRGLPPPPSVPRPSGRGETRGHDRQRAETGADGAAPIRPHAAPGQPPARLASDARGIQGAGVSRCWEISPLTKLPSMWYDAHEGSRRRCPVSTAPERVHERQKARLSTTTGLLLYPDHRTRDPRRIKCA